MIEVVEQIEEMVPYYIAEGSAVYLARKISDNGEAEIYTIMFKLTDGRWTLHEF